MLTRYFVWLAALEFLRRRPQEGERGSTPNSRHLEHREIQTSI